jgi:DNA polymerase I
VSKTLYLIDALGLLFRAYHALPPMSNDKGEETHALFGFIRQLHKILKDFKPTHCAAVFDGPDNKASRLEICPLYKSNREKAPDELVNQMILAEKYCQLLGILTITNPGIEADDTIGSIAHWTESQDIKLNIFAQDKDLYQLVTDKTRLINIHKNNLVIDSKAVKARFGIGPNLVRDFLALVGDSSDFVIGLKGVGPKTAAKWLTEAGSLDAILNNPACIADGKRVELIEANRDRLDINRKLVSLHKKAPFPKNLEAFSTKPPQKTEVIAFLKRFQFHSLVSTVDEVSGQKGGSATSKLKTSKRHLVNCAKDLEDLSRKIMTSPCICIDTETTGINPMQAKLVGIGLAFDEINSYYVPLNGNLDYAHVINVLKPAFEHTKGAFFGHNIKYDMIVLWQAGFELKCIDFDTMVASYLLSAASHRHSLDALALEHFDHECTPITALIGKGKSEISMCDVPIEKVKDYCLEDIEVTWQLRELFEAKLQSEGLKKLFSEVEIPLVTILARMQRAGMYVAVEPLKSLGEHLSARLESLQQVIFSLAGQEFNINSPKQLGAVLFENLNIHPPKKTKTGYSTNADVLESIKDEHPIAEKIIEYRTLEKLRSTYVDTLPDTINPKTGCIHCTFNQTMTATGRLSCHSPNLQNIPVRSSEGIKIREAFLPKGPENIFISADYSQIELRVLAHLSGDPALIHAFERDEDIHAYTASLIYNVDMTDVTSEMRHSAKAVNFGIIYGQGPFGLSQNLKIDRKTAKQFIEAYFERYPKVRAFLDECKKKAFKEGRTATLLGRIRNLPETKSKNPHILAAAERLATNTPIQGSGADIIKLAMVKLDKELKKSNARAHMVLQIHDEIMLEVDEADKNRVETILIEAMESAYPLKVPLKVSLKVGKNWAKC